jgi:hypothetical protein
MNHTAYDVRLVATQVNRARFNDIFSAIEQAAETGAYQHIVLTKKLKPIELDNLSNMLINLGFEVRIEPAEFKMFVSWMDKEKLSKQ